MKGGYIHSHPSSPCFCSIPGPFKIHSSPPLNSWSTLIFKGPGSNSDIRGVSSEENHSVYVRRGRGDIDDEHYNDDDDYINDILPSQGEGDDTQCTELCRLKTEHYVENTSN